MTYFDDTKGEKYIPYVIEPSLGADRVVLAFLCAAYDEENIGTEEKPDVRTVFHFHPALAPVKIGVLPLSKKLNDGADIIDVGGESTRPNYTKISDEEEIERVVPVIEKIKADFDVPVSIDTYKSKVAAAAVGAGADLVNDIWGLKYDKNMAEVIAKSGAACCLMHNRENTEYISYIREKYLKERKKSRRGK